MNRIEIGWTYPYWCLYVAVFGSRLSLLTQSTAKHCNIQTPIMT